MTNDPQAPEDVPLNRWGFIPPWAPLLVAVAVAFTGVVLGEVSTVYLVLFFLSSIVCTALVELRGLFLTVVTVPFAWFGGITVIGYFADRASFSDGNRKTALLTAVFPAVENYLWLLVSFVVSLLIALVRQRLDAAARERALRLARQRRRRSATADEDNRRVTSRVRDLERTADRDRDRDREREDTAERAPSAQRARTVTRPPRHTRTGDSPATASSTSTSSPEQPEIRTRTAEELRAASERRRAREESSHTARHRGDDAPLDI
ncbi:MAG: DUF6542 domain-containing protein [Corynebacterium variabile]|uniref:DUF6542 domain-containing protein n=2 Tax=Corynebacterium variabile TaxID=1727 RepID=UPI00264A1348|nr:DUF6542 domain-containing protein [Corynebacterium variabile]MDN6239956.1 hypothetical protein [Corynebacterium variabile]MDN6478294.1 hypothetical protein [Corynebacterium variabile]MDN6660893.1 hypothetical protein [Corynebacterium variabile]MDN6675697.1 hypothetical protein [Corynebacterium variabile]